MIDLLTKDYFNLIMLIIGIISVFIAIVAIIISIYSIRKSEKIAYKSRAFDKPDIRIGIKSIKEMWGTETKVIHLSEDLPLDLYYGFKFEKNALVIGQLPIIFSNAGQKTQKNLQITFRYPKLFQMAINDKILGRTISGEYTKPKRKKSTMGNFDYVSYHISSLNPQKGIFLEDPIRLSETKSEENIYIEALKERMMIDINLLVNIQISVSGEDFQPIDYKINFICFDSKNMNDLRNHFFADLKKKGYMLRKRSSFIDYLLMLLNRKEINSILIYPSLEKSKVINQFLYSSENTDFYEIKAYSHNNIVWKMLFRRKKSL